MKKPIRGYIPKKDNPQTLDEGLTEVALQLIETKDQVIKEVEDKLSEVDSKLEETNKKLEEVTEKALEEVKSEVQRVVLGIENGKDGEKGEPGEPAEPLDPEPIIQEVISRIELPVLDEEKLTADILAKVPKLNEKRLLKEFLSKVPKDKASLKIIRESFETDPMSVIDKILALAKDGKFKLKAENIDGLTQTISAFHSQIGKRGYLHGGGDTVVAGTNITIVSNANGTKTISATPSSTSLSVRTVLVSDSMTNSDDVLLVDSSGGAVTITLQAVAGASVKRYTIKKIDSSLNQVSITANGVETIDGANSQVIKLPFTSVDLVPNGSFWSII